MVEALIAAVILSISVIGVLATMSSQKTPTVESDKKVQAAMAAKAIYGKSAQQGGCHHL